MKKDATLAVRFGCCSTSERSAYLSLVLHRMESTGDGASTTSAPHESKGHGPIKEDNISMGSKGAQVTDEVVAADWTKEP